MSESDPPKTSLIRSSFAIACAPAGRSDARGCAANAAASRAEASGVEQPRAEWWRARGEGGGICRIPHAWNTFLKTANTYE